VIPELLAPNMTRFLVAALTFLCSDAAAASERSLLARRSPDVKDCEDDFNDLKAGKTCTATWKQLTKGKHRLRPTSPSFGHANVARLADAHFDSKKKASKWFEKHQIPAVIGNSELFLVDNGHHMFAVQENSDIWDLDITVKLVDDLRDVHNADFWSVMEQRNYCLLLKSSFTDPLDMPIKIDPYLLPTGWDLSMYSDNMWRSLASFAEHQDDEGGYRCFVEVCNFLVDNQWAYVMQAATVEDSRQPMWPSDEAKASFLKAFKALPVGQQASRVNLGAWQSLGAQVLPLCRDSSIKDYALPEVFVYPTLMGWHSTPLPSNPDCGSNVWQNSSLV